MSQHFVKLDGAPQEEQIALKTYLDNTYPFENYQFRIEVTRFGIAQIITVRIFDADQQSRHQITVTAQDYLARHPESPHPTFDVAKMSADLLVAEWELDQKPKPPANAD